MVVVVFEHNYINSDRNSKNGIINNTIQEYKRKYSEGYRKIDWKYNFEFFDKIKSKTKNITTRRGVEKRILASNG